MKKTLLLLKLQIRHFSKTNTFLFTISILFIFIFLEFICRIYNYDIKTMYPSLYFESSPFNELYRESSPKRIYELMPNQNKHINDPLQSTPIHVITNNAGFRNDFDIEQKTNKYRIVILGGSNTFGYCVNNTDTYATLMQKEFDKIYPNKVEVLNAGLCAYVMTQKVAYAEDLITKYNPDMIIFQDINTGRRPFSIKIKPSPDLFLKNQQLYQENIPLIIFNNFITKKIHYFLVRHSSFYRTTMTTLNKILIAESNAFRNKFKEKTEAYGEIKNKQSFTCFVKKYSTKKTIFLFNPTVKNTKEKEFVKKRDGYYTIIFGTYGLPKKYLHMHPDKHAYFWFAKRFIPILEPFIIEHFSLDKKKS